MRATIARMPGALRLCIGLFTVVVLAFFGLTLRSGEGHRVLGTVFIALAVFRLVVWLREVVAALARAVPRGESGDESVTES